MLELPEISTGWIGSPLVLIVERLRAAGCVFAEDEARLLTAAARSPDELAELVERRVSGVPLEYVLGWVKFCGLHLAIAEGVFVPRRRSELMVHEAVSRARTGAVVVELCCGSAAIATAITVYRPDIEAHAADLDPVAVTCARQNLGAHVHHGDLYAALPAELRGRIDVLVANAPYVPTDALATMPPEARLYEPRLALDGGGDGLDVLRRVIADARDWLGPAGWLLVESSRTQAPAVAERMAAAGLRAELRTDDEIGATVVVGFAV
jgi:release factor glutamine methyltransferase